MTISHGVGAPISRLQAIVLKSANRRQPSASETIDSGRVAAVLPAVFHARHHVGTVADLLSGLNNSAERMAAMDMTCPARLVCQQYSDDNFMPASSDVQNIAVWKGCEAYSIKHGPRFHLGPGKSASMPLSGTRLSATMRPMYYDQHVDVVYQQTYIGISLSRSMTGDSHFSRSRARWHAAFEKLFAGALSLSIPRLFVAKLVPTHVCPVALYGIAFCIQVHGAEQALNHMQADWARAILNSRGFQQGCWSWLLAECGWTRRLGTAMFGEAVMLAARVSVLPNESFARRVLEVALSPNCSLRTWADGLAVIYERLGNIPSFRHWLLQMGHQSLDIFTANRNVRKETLRQYRLQVLHPALETYDMSAFLNQAPDAWPYTSFNPEPIQLPSELLRAHWRADQWQSYQIWSLCRVTGRLALPPCGIDMFPHSLESCPCCQHPTDIDLQHVLSVCPDLHQLREDYGLPNAPWHVQLSWMFTGWDVCDHLGNVHGRISYVAEAIRALAAALMVESAVATDQ